MTSPAETAGITQPIAVTTGDKPAIIKRTTHKVAVTDRNGTVHSFAVPVGNRILHEGLMAGIGLPYECATGTCGSCKAKLVKGDIDRVWADAPAAAKFRRPDDVLMCQITPCSDVSLSIRTGFTDPPSKPCHALTGHMMLERLLTPEVGIFRCDLTNTLDYAAGQFALVEIEGIDGGRAYSMTNFAPGTTQLDFLIRKAPEGVMTAFLFDQSATKHAIQLTGPFGQATFNPAENRPFVAIAGGSGIAGILSIIEHAQASESWIDGQPSKVFFGLRTVDTGYLLDDLNRAVLAAQGGLDVCICLSDEQPSEAVKTQYPALNFASGFVHEVADQAISNTAGATATSTIEAPQTGPVYFVAGPPPMVDAAMRMLVIEFKISPTEIRYDKFG